ncbi:MAG: DUF1570 domain-containing protein [Planctomycetes bacterium]|nr:DUF1570 domain-containing protein [Planctomycetota bacterium]
MWYALALGLLLLAPPQNQKQPGLVHLGAGEWGTPAQAAERGMIPYRGQWFAKAHEKDLRKWEKEDAKGLDWKEAYKTKSKYYRIETNVARHVIELEIKPFLDALFETYTRVFAEDFGLSGKAAGNKDIRIYDGFQAYSVNEPEGGKPRPRSNPGFIVSGSVLVVFYEETDPGVFYSTVFHEGAHQFFLSLLPGASPPMWLSEALATYFEGCTYSRATNQITPGFVSDVRLRDAQGALRKNPAATAQELFLEVPNERFKGLEYGLAWSFVHYLIHRPGAESRARFARFVQATNGAGSKPATELFSKTTGEDLLALLPAWRAHVLTLTAPPAIQWAALVVSKASPSEDLRSRDLVWSFDGVEVFSAKQFAELWKNRAKDRPLEVVVVRCEPDFDSQESTRRFVRVTLQPASEIRLTAQGELERKGGLSD